MKAFSGICGQVRLGLRLDRWRLLIWIAVIGAVFVAVAESITSLYPDAARRDTYATLNEASPVLQAINGPGYALDTLGGIMLFEVGAYTLVAVALMVVFGTVRSTRSAEERGHTELVLAGAIGTLAPLASSMLIMVAAATVIGAVCALGMTVIGVPASGAWLFGLSVAAIGVFFTGLTALSAQLLPSGESTAAVTGTLLGVWYVVRGAGDLGDIEILTSASPFGWVQYAAPFASDQRIWPLLVTIAGGVILAAVAFLLRKRRDLGAAVWSRGIGPAEGSNTTRGILTATWKIAVPVMAGWALGAAFLGAVFGIAGDELSTLFEVNPDFALVLGADQSEISDKYLRLVIQLVGLIAAGYAVASIQRQRTLEHLGLAEHTLATSVSRVRWLVAALLLSLVGSALILVAGGGALGVAYATVTDDAPAFARTLLSTVWQVPAVWLLTAFAVALLGALPSYFAVAWAAYGITVIVGLLGPVLQMSDVLRKISPFSHMPQLPDTAPAPGLWPIIATTLALLLYGILRIRKRDIGQ